MDWFKGFDQDRFAVNGTEIFARFGGTRGKPPLLLLHGFPQTHALWHRVARQLAADYFLVIPDLRGYGDSARPPGLPDHANYSKREMARDMAGLMTALGCEDFFACGHDRGGRVAHRLALDHPRRVRKLCVIDIAPTLDMYEATDMAFARAYYHWFHLIQPSPLPETMIGGCPCPTCMPSWGDGAQAAWATSSRRRWRSTSAASTGRMPSIQPARTTARRPASTWHTTAQAARQARRSAATSWCCGASAAPSRRCSSRWTCGRPSATAT